MKRSLLREIVIGYIIYGIIGFIIIYSVASSKLNDSAVKNEASSLYREATVISSQYIIDYYSGDTTITQVWQQLNVLQDYLCSKIWIVNPSGHIIINSASFNSTESLIEDFDPSSLGNRHYQLGNYYNKFSENMLSVTSPIVSDYTIMGYIVIHKPVADIISKSDITINIYFILSTIIYVISFIPLVIYLVCVHKPLKHISKTALEYASDNFENQIQYNTNNELGQISNSLDYLSVQLNTLEEYQHNFIANISHDFRSPLTSIKGYTEAMIDGTIPVEMQERYLHIILSETERLTKLTSSLLTLNTFESNGIIIEPTIFDINTIIKGTAAAFEGICSEKKISIEIILAGKELFVSADMGKIQQVLYNLIDNAIKFSSNNSIIYIETSVKNGKVFVSVKDMGIGIPKDSLKKIWERFYKTDLSRGKDKKGTGLGLTIVKEIIQSHGQNINVISTEGVGTEFIFTLPVGEI